MSYEKDIAKLTLTVNALKLANDELEEQRDDANKVGFLLLEKNKAQQVVIDAAVFQLQGVLCNPEGVCCIDGSDADREEVNQALAALTKEELPNG